MSSHIIKSKRATPEEKVPPTKDSMGFKKAWMTRELSKFVITVLEPFYHELNGHKILKIIYSKCTITGLMADKYSHLPVLCNYSELNNSV